MIGTLSKILIVTMMLVSSAAVLAVGDQFIIGQVVVDSADVVPPTTPTDLVATAVSSSQIDLSWTASTDNVLVAGYLIYRDSVQIATSTVTAYSDTGLAPETEYSYTVLAFDGSGNFSSSSAVATATTFAVPPTPTPSTPSGGSSGGFVFFVESLSVQPGFTDSEIRLSVSVPVQVSVRWGLTSDYESGSLSGDLFSRNHVLRIPDLLPATTYFFEIRMVDGYGRALTISDQQFKTLALPDFWPPANVSNFSAGPTETEIRLSWNNPSTDFRLVRIVRSNMYYPQDPFDGEIVYEGRARSFVDTDVVFGQVYYYTAFTLDEAGNYSSGAVTNSRLLGPGEEYSPPKLFADIIKLSNDLIHPLLRNIDLADIEFYQNDKLLPVSANTVEISSDRNLRIAIDYDRVPEILKTIVVTVVDPEDSSKTFSFLLRVNSDKTAYEANIGAFERSGRYEFSLAILDYKHQGLALLSGAFIAKAPDILFGDYVGQPDTSMAIYFLVLLLGILAVMFVIFRKRLIPADQVSVSINQS